MLNIRYQYLLYWYLFSHTHFQKSKRELRVYFRTDPVSMTLLRVMYKQLRTKAHHMDHLMLSTRGLIPRRELARYAKYLSPEFGNQSDEDLAASVSQGILFKSVVQIV